MEATAENCEQRHKGYEPTLKQPSDIPKLEAMVRTQQIADCEMVLFKCLIAQGANTLAASGRAGIAVSLAGRSQCSEMPFLPTEMKGSLGEQLIYQDYSAQI